MANRQTSLDFPIQTIPDSKKTASFYKDCAKKAIKLIGANSDQGVRFSRYDRSILYALGVDEIDPRDMEKTFNPLNLEDLKDSFKDIKNMPFEQGIFTLLKGEEVQRPFTFQVKLTNPEAVSEINNKKKQILIDFISEKAQSQEGTPEQIKDELNSLIDNLLDYRDLRAIKAKKLVDKVDRDNKLQDTVFSKTFDNNLYVGEEIAFFDIVNDNIKVQAVNDLNLYLISSGNTNRVEDSDIIIYVDYLNLSQIISYFRDELTETQIKSLQDNSEQEENYYPEFSPGAPTADNVGRPIDEAIFSDDNLSQSLGSIINDGGDYRVIRVFWKGKKKVKVIQTIDEAGNVFREIQDSKYELREDLGEVLDSTIWLDTWEQCTEIAGKEYVRGRAWEGLVYSKTDFSMRSHPFIGYINTLNGIAPTSLMAKIKNLKYLYNVLRKELELAIGRNMGNVAEIDIAYVPDTAGWTFERMMYLMKTANIKVVDSLKKTEEGNYHNNNTTGKNINLSQFDHIQTLTSILDQIKAEVYEITGVTPQRLGQVANRETKGGIERSVLQSSNTTEPIFRNHDIFKGNVYTNIMELSKVWADGSMIQISDWGDDNLQLVEQVDGSEYSEWDYGIYITDTAKDLRLKGLIEEMAPTLMQAQVLPVSDYLSMIANDDMTLSFNILKRAEKNKDRKEAQAAQQQQQLQQQQNEAIAQAEQVKFERELQLEEIKTQREELIQRLKNENALELKELEIEIKNTQTELDKEKLDLDKLRAEMDRSSKDRELTIKDKDLEIKRVKSNTNK